MGKVKDLFGNDVEVEAAVEVGQERFPRLARYAEFMVCAYLTKMGYYCVHVDTTGFDLIMDYKGHSYRIDVKSTQNIQHGSLKESCEWSFVKSDYKGGERYKSRPIGPEEVDLLALYHLAFDTVIFIPVLRPMRRLALPATQVRLAGSGEASLAIAIEQLRGARQRPTDEEED